MFSTSTIPTEVVKIPTEVDLESGMYAGWRRKPSKKDATKFYLRSPDGKSKLWESEALKNVQAEARRRVLENAECAWAWRAAVAGLRSD